MNSIVRLGALRSWHRPLTLSSALMMALAVFSAVGMAVDDRQILGESVWLKPAKFGFGFAAYGLTLAWLLSRLTRARRTGWWTGTVFAVAGPIDVGAVAYAAAHGTFSHFNDSTGDVADTVHTAFGIGVMPLMATTLVAAVLVLAQPARDRALKLALAAGLLLAVASMGVAVWLSGTGAPRTVPDAAGNPVPLSGGHGIGDPDGRGMPLTNWSLTGGDLRVPHFMGMHALHVLLLVLAVMWLAGTRSGRPLDDGTRTRVIGLCAFWYAGVFAVLTWQAKRGQSVAHPDVDTLGALAGVSLIALVGVGFLAHTSAAARPDSSGREAARPRERAGQGSG
ncbi:hypothetical protein [Streptomyces sp. NPDC050504]|uniref:hypothetical protein n=1 Tax=Streptomyces sp. NPDC050504 TaxID=3365618 RepID=UPI00379737B1